MNHALILPLLVPLFVGALLLLCHRMGKPAKRILSLAATWALVPIAIWLLLLADDGQLRVYALGNWQAPFGIILMLDRSALMLLVTAVLAGFAVLYACRGDDERGPNFHALYQFQLLGINGAFLTGDLFNLFVFFEILLISSYALLLHGHGQRRVRSGMHYVVLNLLGSSLFLIGVSMLYGLLGTLNMADLAGRVSAVDPADAPLLAAAGYLLLVVFALKGRSCRCISGCRGLCIGYGPGRRLVRNHDQGRPVRHRPGVHAGVRQRGGNTEQHGRGLALAVGAADARRGRDRCAGGAQPAGAARLSGGGLGRYPAGRRGAGHDVGLPRHCTMVHSTLIAGGLFCWPI